MSFRSARHQISFFLFYGGINEDNPISGSPRIKTGTGSNAENQKQRLRYFPCSSSFNAVPSRVTCPDSCAAVTVMRNRAVPRGTVG